MYVVSGMVGPGIDVATSLLHQLQGLHKIEDIGKALYTGADLARRQRGGGGVTLKGCVCVVNGGWGWVDGWVEVE